MLSGSKAQICVIVKRETSYLVAQPIVSTQVRKVEILSSPIRKRIMLQSLSGLRPISGLASTSNHINPVWIIQCHTGAKVTLCCRTCIVLYLKRCVKEMGKINKIFLSIDMHGKSEDHEHIFGQYQSKVNRSEWRPGRPCRRDA